MTDELTVTIALTITESQTVTDVPDTYTNTHSNTHSLHYTPHTTPTTYTHTHTQSDHHSSEENDDESDKDTFHLAASKPVTHTPTHTTHTVKPVTHTSGTHTTTNYPNDIAKPYVSPPLHILTEEKSDESMEEREEEQEMTESDKEIEKHSTQTNQSPFIVLTTPTKITTNQNSLHKTTSPTATNKNTVAATTSVQLPSMRGSEEKEIRVEEMERESEEDKKTERESDLIVNPPNKSQENSAENGDLSATKTTVQTQANTKPSPSKEDERHNIESKEDLQSDEEDESVNTQTTTIPSRVSEVSPYMWIIPAQFLKPPIHNASPRPTVYPAAKPTRNNKTTSTVHKPVSTRTTTSGHAAVETIPHPQKPPRPALDQLPSLTTTAHQESAEEEEQEEEEEEEKEPSDSSQESEKIGNCDNPHLQLQYKQYDLAKQDVFLDQHPYYIKQTGPNFLTYS